MGILANLIVRIGSETGDFDRAIDRATGKIKRFGQDIQQAGSALTLGISAPLAGVGVAAIVAAGKIEQAQTAFTTMMKSADAARTHLEQLKDFALKTPFQFTELVDASRRMQALGFAASDVVPKLRTIGNAVSALGLGAEGLQRVILALGQMQAKGTAQAEEMRQLAEAGIPAWDALAKKLGTDVAGAMKQVEARSVSAGTAISAVLETMDKRFGGGMEAQAKTILGMWSNVKDAIQFTLADIGKVLAPHAKALISDYLQPALDKAKELAKAFADMNPAGQKAALGLGAVAIALPPIIWGTGTLITNFGVIVGAANKVAGALGGLGVIMKALPWAAVAAGTYAVLSKFNDPNKVDSTAKALKNLTETMKLNGQIVADGNPAREGLINFLRGTYTHGPKAAEAIKLTSEQMKKLNERFWETYDRYDKAAKDAVEEALKYQKMQEDVQTANMDLIRSNADLTLSFEKARDAIHETALAQREITSPMNGRMPSDVYDEWSRKSLDLVQNTQRAGADLNIIWAGVADKMKYEFTEVDRYWVTLTRDIQRLARDTFNSLERDIARNVIQWKGGFDTIKRIGQDFASDMLTIVLKGFLKPVEDQFAKLAGKIGGWLGGLFGGGSSVADTAIGAANSTASAAASSASSAASGVTSAVSGGVMSTIGAISSAVSAVSGVVSNFQFAGMNKSLDVLVNHTLRIFNELSYFRADAWDREGHLMLKLDDIWNSIREGCGNIFTRLGEMGGAGGGSNQPIIVQVYLDSKQIGTAQMRTLKAAGVRA